MRVHKGMQAAGILLLAACLALISLRGCRPAGATAQPRAESAIPNLFEVPGSTGELTPNVARGRWIVLACHAASLPDMIVAQHFRELASRRPDVQFALVLFWDSTKLEWCSTPIDTRGTPILIGVEDGVGTRLMAGRGDADFMVQFVDQWKTQM